ncbi:MAG TPA: SulP family inorganic anion transporter [Quisquiliibacterium sp.]|nr:SulP family inorganic anion transporter [Quisquiliibacterium sp.]
MKRSLHFRPALLGELRGYGRARLTGDLAAGVTVGVVALPLAMAFAIASGLPPEAGIFTAIVGGFLVSAFGGSKVQIGGPAGAFIVIVYGIVERYGAANLLVATMFAGVMLFAMGMARLGSLVRYIPVSIVIGFTNGIAVLIALSQVKDFLGLRIEGVPADFFGKLRVIAAHAGEFDPVTLALALASLAIVVFWPKTYKDTQSRAYHWMSRVPGTIVALVAGTLAVKLGGLGVETIGSRFGGIPQSMPSLAFPAFDWGTVRHLFAPALTIALLGAIESLLCARVADSMTEDRHDPNQELMGQGIANFVAPLFGGFCVTGTIARTVTNIRSGAGSPVAGIIHAAVLLAIVLVAAPLAHDIPLATLSAILLFVAWNMGEWHEFARLKQFSMNYRVILLATFFLTVIIDLTVAVEVGLVLACLFFVTRISSLTRIDPIEELEAQRRGLPAGEVEAYRVVGSLFFGAVSKLEGLLDPKRRVPPLTVLELSGLLNLDTTGLDALESLHALVGKRGGRLVLCGLQAQPASLVRRSGFFERLGEDGIQPDLDAVARWHAARG